ncbi:hypothetical protein [Mycobacterium hubeiense]|uniref:hypothetical protein n=1 Tax=Mycobacterium hubeiense TaxID=1867256 RepID=UPI001E5422F5|nr:hypothetical protein [Mycobacterium sp. QGD 101]
MTSSRLARRLALTAGGAAIIGMVSLTAACGEAEQAPEETTPTTTTTTTTTTTPPPPPPVEPTEKAPRIDPGGPNPFSPTVHAPPPPTAVPGHH